MKNQAKREIPDSAVADLEEKAEALSRLLTAIANAKHQWCRATCSMATVGR
jgi:hypothetical protein